MSIVFLFNGIHMSYQEIIFSIIIPHKNIPNLLQRCLNSIPRRKDIQIIVIDDNSDDSIVDFNNFPGLGDKYVEVYLTKEGKGAGYARNVGLKYAKGKWLLFADADDFFTENAFEYLFLKVDSPHEILYFKVTSCYSDTLVPADRGDKVNKFVDDFVQKKTKDTESLIRYKWHMPWGKMIKAEFINKRNIRFDEVTVSNDAMFSLIAGYSASSIGIINHAIYCVTLRKGSLTNVMTKEVLITRYIVALRCNEFCRKHGCGKGQSSIALYYLFSSAHHGISAFYDCLKLAFHYKMNPFWGIKQWPSKYISFHKRMKI
jgi:glycosyltransferase involved in cell wall biosynthesis